jgi:hypothetical protein
VKIRIIYEIGGKVVLSKYGGTCGASFHMSQRVLFTGKSYAEAYQWMQDQKVQGRNLFDEENLWDGKCDRCGGDIADPHRSYGPERIYDTPSGHPEPGDMFTVPCPPVGQDACFHWDNCTMGQHLHVICPDGTDWDIDSRASNCDMPADRTHRCWVREGAPPNVTAGKAGHTCTAGAGSIQTPNYHGMFQNGEFKP